MDNDRVLLVLAHPDDPEFFCGATLAKWARQGKEIRYLLLTCGDKGGDRPDVTPEMLCADRQVEQRAAAAIIGAKEVIFLQYHDGELVNSPEVRRDIVREIRHFKPHIVVTCDPTTAFRNGCLHQSHRSSHGRRGRARCGFSGGRQPDVLSRAAPRGPGAVCSKEIWISLTNEPNIWVDVTDTIAIKIAALKEHKSQIKDPDGMEQRIRDRLHRTDVDRELYAESFRVIKWLVRTKSDEFVVRRGGKDVFISPGLALLRFWQLPTARRFHLWRGGGYGMLLRYLVAAWGGFALGQLVGWLGGWELVMVGQVHVLEGTVGSGVVLMIAYSLTVSPSRPTRSSR